jgi:hypothetical protein
MADYSCAGHMGELMKKMGWSISGCEKLKDAVEEMLKTFEFIF